MAEAKKTSSSFAFSVSSVTGTPIASTVAYHFSQSFWCRCICRSLSCCMLAQHQSCASLSCQEQRSAHLRSRLPLWFTLGGIFLCNWTHSTMFSLSHLWQMEWYFPFEQVFLSAPHHAGSEPHSTLLCRVGCALGLEKWEMLWAWAVCSHWWCWHRSQHCTSDQAVSGAGCDDLQNTGIQEDNETQEAEESFRWVKSRNNKNSDHSENAYILYICSLYETAQYKGYVSHCLIKDKTIKGNCFVLLIRCANRPVTGAGCQWI